MSRQTLNFAAGIIRRHRISIGSLWRKLNPGQQALLVLVYLRKGETSPALRPGSGSVRPLPGGTWRRRSRCSPHGRRDCARRSGTRRGPGTPTSSWTGVLAELEAAGLVTLADKGYQGSTCAKIPYKGKNKPDSQKQANKAHAKLRAPGERANAQLKTWKILTKLRCCPWRAGQLAKAIHVLQLREA